VVARRGAIGACRLFITSRLAAMGIWNKLFKQDDERVDYYREGLELLKVGRYHEALTSFRLALRDAPDDPAVLQQIAITYTRIGMTDEAIKTYRSVLARDGRSAGAHYGLAFLLLREGRRDEAREHLGAFLETPPEGADAAAHIAHARQTLAELGASAVDAAAVDAAAVDAAAGDAAVVDEPAAAADEAKPLDEDAV
jgi:tetratricopeptide (TPR) repeat protein